MPAIQVARTDTFEQQRQKINQIGDQIFNITQGGSDLATGNLKLGDGTRTSPSLAFSSDASLGIYKPSENTFGFVSSGKKVADYSQEAVYTFKDLIIQQNILSSSGISLLNKGSNYDAGTYNNVLLIGGTGDGATSNITVIEYGGEITNNGFNYNQGSYSNIPLTGGSGSGSTVSFIIDGIEGFISNAGSGYIPGVYNNVSLTNGDGTGATANITITGETILSGNITSPGSGYTQGIYNSVQILNKPTQTFVVTTLSNPGTPPPDNVYAIDGETQKELTLIKGNTYRFDISDSSNVGHPLIFQTSAGGFLNIQNYTAIAKGTPGQPGAFIDLVIKPTANTETIKYNCQIHDGMGANISITSGSVGIYATFGFATITVNSSGFVSNFEITSSGNDYKENDILQVYNGDVGLTGSGFEFTLSAPTYTGEITNVSIQSNGENYLINNVLSALSTDLGGVGSGFSFTIDNNPGSIEEITFISRGSGYEVGDILELPKTISGITTTLKGVISDVSTTLSDLSPVITVSDTTGIVAGMEVEASIDSTGQLDRPTTVLSVDSSTQITLSTTPLVSGDATLSFSSLGILNEITVSSAQEILVGSTVEQTSGTGVLSPNTTVSSISGNVITLSEQPTQPGTATLSFIPPFGDPLDSFEYEILNLGEIDSYTITAGGNGYSLLDQLSVNPTDLIQPIIYSVINRPLITINFVNNIPISTFSVGDYLKVKDGELITFVQTSAPQVSPTVIENISTTLSDSSPIITVSDTTGIIPGMLVSQDIENDIGILLVATTVLSVDSSTQITLSTTPINSGSATLSFSSDESGTYQDVESTSSGDGVGATFDVLRDSFGNISSIQVNARGYFYSLNDTITISGSDVGGSSPTDDIILTVSVTNTSEELEIFNIEDDGTNITSVLVDFDNINSGDYLVVPEIIDEEYEVDTTSNLQYRYFINTGDGLELTPSFTLYAGNTYTFDLSDSSNNGHLFSLSEYRDGIWGPSLIENISATLLTTTNQITVGSSTGILPGMQVTVDSGTGALVSETTVLSIVGNTITLSNSPLTSGAVILSFRGVEYTDGVVRSESSLTIQVTENTPNLYYYCATLNSSHVDEGGEDNQEALITIDLNNPKVFGSGFLLSVAELDTTDIITANIETGDLTAVKFIGDGAELNDASVTGTLIAPTITSNSIVATTITSASTLELTGSAINVTGNFNVGSNVQVVTSSGNITTSGVLKTTNSLNINDRLTITNNIISSTAGNNILLSPAVGRVAKIDTTSALTIPSGTTAQRPTSGVVENGSIRFNTETGQYEGYSAASGSWSSLGGVRDLDGNTYIAAEASIGANDNTLYFFNDGNNTVSVTPNYLQFVNVKKIRSVNTTAPTSTEYTTNTQVVLGQYLKYRNNIYEVTTAGQTGSSGNEPTHTTGAVTNGTAVLTWYASAVAPLTFEEVEEVRIDPLGFTNLVVNAELRFSNNTISTDLNDLVIRPNSGKKVTIDAESSLVIPVGDNNQRGVAAQGSIRYNTDISQYEGYDGSNWTSLGGVKDVDGNTYIIPETAPGANENILYFYNDGVNTMRLSTNALDFTNIDAITSQNNNLDIEAQTVTFNGLAATIDTSGTSTFISTTKDNLDLGLAVGLNVDPLLRLDINGDIYLNKAFGTGSFDGIKLFNSDLSSLELSDLAIQTNDIELIKGGTNSGASVLYDPATQSGVRVTVSIVNQTTGDKEMIEYQVTDKGSDIYHTEIGNLNTGINLVSSVFDFDANNNVRVTFTLEDLTVGDVVNITVVKNIFKK